MLTYINLNLSSLSVGHDHDVEESAAQNFKFRLRKFTRAPTLRHSSMLFVDVQKQAPC